MRKTMILFEIIFSPTLFLIMQFVVTSTLADSPSFEDTFRQCLISYHPQSNLRRCLGVGAINQLQSIDSNPEFDFLDSVRISKDANQEYREGSYNFADQDPSDFRSIIDTFDHVFSKRAMRWDMSFIYPGLSMQVAPSVSPGGILEFNMDPNLEAVNSNRVKEIGTGRLLARQFLVPLLLGIKFNVATLVPIMFGILAILAKKIVIISKIALILSSAFGLGSLLFNGGGSGQYGPQYPYAYNQGSYQYHPTTFAAGSYYKGFPEEFSPSNHLQYRGLNNVVVDELRLHGSLPDAFGERGNEENQLNKGRNFAWNEDEKILKKS